jgi:uncharacterized cupin superfamily protein
VNAPSEGLEPGTVTDAASLALMHEPVPVGQALAGAPATGLVELTDSIGIWEHTPGASADVEADEVFVVLSGSATVSFTEPPLPPIELRTGSIVRLTAGMRTVWTVHETLRKVYIAG